MRYLFSVLLVLLTITNAYPLTVYKYSCFAINRSGSYEKDSSGNLIPRDGKYAIDAYLEPVETALVIMDPWVDMKIQSINDCYAGIIKSKILPLSESMSANGYKIIIVTNNEISRSWGGVIHPLLADMVDTKKAILEFHQSHDSQGFADYLKKIGVESLIYCGFASNMCVLYTEHGLIPMRGKGYRLYFVPEASAAMEIGEGWKTGELHKAMTKVIGQGIAQLIDYKDLMQEVR